MTPGQRSRFEPPRVDDRHIARPRLLAQVSRRWDARVVQLVAGAGGGKTSLLAQAISENRLAAVGTDHWLTCGPVHNEPALLLRDLRVALALPGIGSTLSQLLEALYGLAGPNALHLDDFQRLDPDGPSVAMLADLVRDAPPNLHLVVSSRTEPPLPVSRLEAQGLLVRLDSHAFGFDDDEAAAVARLLSTSRELVSSVGGWPAFTALQATVGSEGPVRFLLEEVLHALTHDDRDELAVLIAMGGATPLEMEGALERPSRLAELAHSVPLLQSRSDGTVIAHDLWNQIAESVAVGIDTDRVRVQAARVVAANGDFSRAFDLLVDSNDPTRVVSVVVRTVTISATSPGTRLLDSWNARLPPSLQKSPVSGLIDGMIRYNEQDLSPETRDILLSAIDGARAAKMVDVELAALILGILVTQVRNESSLRLPLILRLAELAAFGSPQAKAATSMAEAGICMLADDDVGVLECLDRLDTEAMSTQWLALAHGMRSQSLLMLGRDDEAREAAVAHGVVGASDEAAAIVLALFFSGVDRDLIDVLTQIDDHGVSVVGDQVIRCYSDLVGAWCGYQAKQPTAGPPFGDADAPEMMLTLAQTRAIAELNVGRVEDASTALVRAVDEAPERTAWRCLRRFSGFSYVLAPSWRERLMEADLPSLRAAERQQGLNLVRLRANQVVDSCDWADPPRLLSSLPLALTVEVAVRRWALEDSGAERLVDHLALVAPVATWELVRGIADSKGVEAPESKALAEKFLAEVPAPFPEQVTLRLLGPTELLIGDRLVESPELLKRKRVRQLLALLGVERSTERARIYGLLWPDSTDNAAAANLRTNLKHLLAAIEPGRRPGEAAFLVRSVGTRLELAGAAYVSVDIEMAERSIDEAESLLGAGAPSEAMHRFEAAVDLWRGRPLEDLADLADFTAATEHLTARLVAAAVRAAEIRLARSETERASELATKALHADPWAEPAHRISIDAAWERGDRTLARHLSAGCSEMLRALGVEPAPETAMAIRRVV